ncbi:MAG: hypothetical protein M3O33_21170 [Cyanobacteriota bacterium]|nr:hypothetical protein [Cyanobacteriota bacterium]
MTLCKIVSGLLTATLLISSVTNVQAQSRRPPRISSLGEIKCRGVQGSGYYSAINEEIPIRREIFRAIGIIATHAQWIGNNRPVELVCQIAALNQAPRFKTLTLAFGFSDDAYTANGATVRLSIYKDGNFYGSQSVSKGDKLRWPVDIKNTRNLALEAECISTRRNSNSCPALYFFEDVLE